MVAVRKIAIAHVLILVAEFTSGLRPSKPTNFNINRKMLINRFLLVATTTTATATITGRPAVALQPIGASTISNIKSNMRLRVDSNYIFATDSSARIPSGSDSLSNLEAIEILQTQRLACDNIASVISNGDLNEAAFKGVQLASQVKIGGKIILQSLQQGVSSDQTLKNKNEPIDIVRYLQCQKEFAILIEACDEFNIQIEKSLRGKLGVSAVAQLQLLPLLDELRSAYDRFLLSVDSFKYI